MFKVTNIFWDVTVCNLLADANLRRNLPPLPTILLF